VTDRKRDALPAGYQFGDAREPVLVMACPFCQRGDLCPEWRSPSDTAAEQLARRAFPSGMTANVIEGEEHE
jgi:hypothetical protein